MQRHWLAFAGAVTAAAMFVVTAQAQQKPTLPVEIPNPGVPQAMTIEGKFVKPTFAGELITTHGVVREKTPEGNGFRLKVELWADNEEGEVKTIAWATAYVE